MRARGEANRRCLSRATADEAPDDGVDSAKAAVEAVASSAGEASIGGRSPGPPAAAGACPPDATPPPVDGPLAGSTSPGAPISAMGVLTGTVVPA
jgi:hypothetical protein